MRANPQRMGEGTSLVIIDPTYCHAALSFTSMRTMGSVGSQSIVDWGEEPPSLDDDAVLNVVNLGEWTVLIDFGAHTPTINIEGVNLSLNGEPLVEPTLVTFDAPVDGPRPQAQITGPSIAGGAGSFSLLPDFFGVTGDFYDGSVLIVPVPEPGAGLILGVIGMLAASRRTRL